MTITQPVATLIASAVTLVGSGIIAFLTARFGLYAGLRRHQGEKGFEARLAWLVTAHDRAWVVRAELERAGRGLYESASHAEAQRARDAAASAIRDFLPICLQASVYAQEELAQMAEAFWFKADVHAISWAVPYGQDVAFQRLKDSDEAAVSELALRAHELGDRFAKAARAELGLRPVRKLMPSMPDLFAQIRGASSRKGYSHFSFSRKPSPSVLDRGHAESPAVPKTVPNGTKRDRR